jgi:predicted nucleic acid-binding protein
VKVLVDTSVLIDHLRGHLRANRLLQQHAAAGDELCASTVVRTEVLAGMRKGEETATYNLLNALHWQDVTIEIADLAGEMARKHLKSHPGVDLADFLIAATATSIQAELLTQNIKHFPMIAGLRAAYS